LVRRDSLARAARGRSRRVGLQVLLVDPRFDVFAAVDDSFPEFEGLWAFPDMFSVTHRISGGVGEDR
jgi:hypothetical protein